MPLKKYEPEQIAGVRERQAEAAGGGAVAGSFNRLAWSSLSPPNSFRQR